MKLIMTYLLTGVTSEFQVGFGNVAGRLGEQLIVGF